MPGPASDEYARWFNNEPSEYIRSSPEEAFIQGWIASERARTRLPRLGEAAVAYVKAKDAAHEYAVTVPLQTPYPERGAASAAADAAKAELIEAAEWFGRHAPPPPSGAPSREEVRESVRKIVSVAMNASACPPAPDHGAAWVRQRADDATDDILRLFARGPQ